MKRITSAVALALAAPLYLAAASLFSSAAQSKWSVSDGKSVIATATVTTDGKKVRVDWTPSSGPASSFVAADNKIWLKGNGGDSPFNDYKDAVGRAIIPAFLLPSQLTAGDKVAANGAKATSYSYAGSTASYTYDAKGAQKIDIAAGAKKYTLTRTDLSAGTGSSAAFYAVQEKQGKLAGLRSMGKGLLGSNDSSVSASAGVKGMDNEEAMKEGIDLAAVEQLLTRDESQSSTRQASLKKFQKEGKVGGAQ